jgi:hypothetical protein
VKLRDRLAERSNARQDQAAAFVHLAQPLDDHRMATEVTHGARDRSDVAGSTVDYSNHE